jgi:hypothetical protein
VLQLNAKDAGKGRLGGVGANAIDEILRNGANSFDSRGFKNAESDDSEVAGPTLSGNQTLPRSTFPEATVALTG